MRVYTEEEARSWGGHLTHSSDSELACVLDLAKKHGGPILDLACGAGRMSAKLAQAGYDVYGLDASLPMLRMGRESLKKHSTEVQNRVRFICGDMTNFSLGREFPLIIIAFCSFGYVLDTARQGEEVITRILEHLDTGGVFFIDRPVRYPFIQAYRDLQYNPPHQTAEKEMIRWWKEMSERHGLFLTGVRYAGFWDGDSSLKRNFWYVGHDVLFDSSAFVGGRI